MSKSTPKLIQSEFAFPQSGPNPSGLCLCGCGQPTPIATQTNNARGIVKGQPCYFIPGHQRIIPHLDPNPSGLCMCGCGQVTAIAKTTHGEKGIFKGQHKRYIAGHQMIGRILSPVEDRFWAKVTKDGPIHPVLGTACWDWTGSRSSARYGQILVGDHLAPAHRFSYELHVGPIPEGLFVCHHCDNPPCTNPEHLFLGTASDNSKDAADKGRLMPPRHSGSAHPQAKLTEADVLEIRRRAAGGESAMNLAVDYGVHFGTIYSIINRETWTHV